MEEKYESFKQKILKLNELALRGEEGEAINARKAMVRLCSTLGVNVSVSAFIPCIIQKKQ